MWRKEYRIVYYSWEFDTLQSFYRDLLRLPQMYGWYTSPVDRGCKFKIGDNRLELICRHPTLPQGPAGMRLEAKDEYTAILFAEDLEKITAFYRDSMQMPVVTSWDAGVP